jgi:hypothetical protein
MKDDKRPWKYLPPSRYVNAEKHEYEERVSRIKSYWFRCSCGAAGRAWSIPNKAKLEHEEHVKLMNDIRIIEIDLLRAFRRSIKKIKNQDSIDAMKGNIYE